MGKYYESKTALAYTWEQIASGFWKRYPNPQSTHVLTEDTLTREIRGDCLFTKRLLTKTNRVPKWGERFVKSSVVAIVEESYVDLKTKVMTTYTRNIGLSKVMSVTEKVTYTPDPSNPTQTIVSRSAWIDSQLYGFRRAIEAFGLDRFKINAARATEGFDYVLRILFPRQQSSLTNFNINMTEASSSAQQQLQINNIPNASDETMKDRLREKAKKAGELARQSAEKIHLVPTANCDS